LGDKGEPVEPKGIAARFRNIVDVIVRDQLASWITTTKWKTVPKAMKDVLWAKVKEKFVYPEGTENAGRTFVEAFVEELLGIGGLHLILNLSRKERMLGMCMVTFRLQSGKNS
jgi:hypothetical protein